MLCETNINACASSPCQNGATCVNGLNTFTCQCATDYGGTLCELDLNHCRTNPCRNGATCLSLTTSYYCSCASGYVGTTCQQVSVACNTAVVFDDNNQYFACRPYCFFLDVVCGVWCMRFSIVLQSGGFFINSSINKDFTYLPNYSSIIETSLSINNYHLLTTLNDTSVCSW